MGGQGASLTLSCNRLWICSITLHHVQCSGSKPQQWVWGKVQGIFDGLCSFSAAFHVNIPCMWPSWGGEVYNWDNLCKGGWVFTASHQRLCHISKSSPPILSAPKASQSWFWGWCWVWLSFLRHSSPSALFTSPWIWDNWTIVSTLSYLKFH